MAIAYERGHKMKRLFVAAILAILVFLIARYFGLVHGPVIVGGQVASVVL